jgi:PAS domain S-box-containing protein
MFPGTPPWVSALLEALDHSGMGLTVTRDGPSGLDRVYTNRSFQRIFGRNEEEMRAAPPMAAIVPEDRARFVELRQKVQAGADAPPVLETAIVRPDGSRVPIEIFMTTHREDSDVYALVFLRDLTDRRALQARALEADRLATVGALCAGLAHEINNPLTSVLLHLGGLRRSLDRKPPEDAARAQLAPVLEAVIEGAERVSRTVRELLVFADPAIGRTGPVDVRGVVEGAVRAAGPIVESRARLAVGFAPVPPVTGDSPRLGQAVLNVILDAAHAFDSDDRGHNLVEVNLRAEEPWVIVEVADNGRALELGASGSAFEPFFPVRGATSTGIGLAVTRTIVSAIGGSATMAPRDGGGAITTIRLPRA